MVPSLYVKPLVVADLNVWTPVLVEADVDPVVIPNTLTSKVLVVTLVIVNHCPWTGSDALGYEWSVVCWSFSQVNVKELSASLILSVFENPWPATVSVVIPVVGL